ncbi:DUF2147 domain-containing protein [Methylobacterium sp. J-076]|uniref:DUF2147 domain-containing protein n=1 Tax=Methylobacterium sp. J-076 TaxID=2836655 RepID=UPI001FBA7220|nr:DUF2147 domain-containing protein [Methylobacterium sp. J-076]MCJ2012787.1 DUF2147 domain-containing protein [Methylobacterium sp. J-076]
MTAPIYRLGTLALVAVVAGATCGRPEAARAAEPYGTWLTEDGRARVRTEQCGSDASRLCGFIVWMKEPSGKDGSPKVDHYSPNTAWQGRPQMGHQMLIGLKPDAEGHFEGKIYNAENGKFYDVSVWSDQPSALTVKGCMLVFCASQSWKRVADLVPGQLQGPTDGLGGPVSDPEWASKGTRTGSTSAKKPSPEGAATHAR